MRILVVDSYKRERATLTSGLARCGHDCATADDGHEAWNRLEHENFDAVFSDVTISKVDGIELLKRIKDGPSASTPVVLMSPNGTIPLAVQAAKLGAFDFISKPFPRQELLRLVDRIELSSLPTEYAIALMDFNSIG